MTFLMEQLLNSNKQELIQVLSCKFNIMTPIGLQGNINSQHSFSALEGKDGGKKEFWHAESRLKVE